MSDINAIVDTLSPEEVDLLNSDPQMLAEFKAKYSAPAASAPKSGILGQAWEDLKVPEQKSREGLKMITDAGVKGQNWLANKTGLPIGTEPTGNTARDILANTPRILGETLTETAPSFVSRGAIATAGLLRGAGKVAQAAKPAAKWLAAQAEGSSGLSNVPVKTPGLLVEEFNNPGLLVEEFNNPGLLMAPGVDEANQMYKAVQNGYQNIRPILKYTKTPGDFVSKAMEFANDGSLTTDEALAARQELDGIKNQVTDAFYRNARGVLDYIAKADYSGADEAYKTGMKADALRSFSAINKNGTPSVGRSALTLLKPWTALAYSPVVQAGIAGAAGKAAQAGAAINRAPSVVGNTFGIADNIKKLMGKKENK